MNWQILIWAILMGAVNGMGISAIGILSKKKIPSPDSTKFFITVAIGAIVGSIAGYNGWDYTTAEQWLTSSGLIPFIYLVLKAIWRRTHKGEDNEPKTLLVVKRKKKVVYSHPKRRERWQVYDEE